jgi:hypothetical protein
MRFDAAAALQSVKIQISADVEPILSDDQVRHCLTFAAVADSSGLYPDEEDYTPTYSTMSLNLAYGRACRLKAMKLGEAADYSDANGNSHRPQDRRQFFLDMARDYESKAVSIAQTRTNRYAEPFGVLDTVIAN